MRKLQPPMNVSPSRAGDYLAAVLLATVLCLNPAQADITNVIWKATLTGNLAIQQHDANLFPRMSVAKFSNKSFISMVGGAGGDVLGVNVDMAGGKTNVFLSLYDGIERKNSFRITTNEITTLISDGKNLAFTVEAPLISTFNTWGGGFLRIAGTGHIVKGVPAQLNGSVEGVFIDNRPGDLNGTTGLVLRARLNTSTVPLRVLPQE